MNSEKLGTLKMILAMLISGTIGIFVLESGQSVFNVVFFRCLIGAVCIGLYASFRGYLHKISMKELMIILIGGASIVINWILLFKSYEYSSIGLSTVVYHTQPFFVVLLASFLLQEKLTKSKLFLICLAFIGVVLVIDPMSKIHTEGWVLGLSLALVAAVFYGLATVAIKLISGVSSYTIVLIQLTLGVVLLFPFFESSHATFVFGKHWYWLIGLGIIHTCVMYVLMYDAFKQLPAIKIAVLSYIYPVVAVILDYFIYETPLNIIQFLGMLLIIASGFLVNNIDIFNKFVDFIFSKKNKI